jgi:hypothetical protein
MVVNENWLNLMYLRAKSAFVKCISDTENDFLVSEIGIPVHNIVLKEKSVSLCFYGCRVGKYKVETKIQLLSHTNSIIGSYKYYEDENGVPIDDSLVFF